MTEYVILHVPHTGLELPAKYLGDILVPDETLRLWSGRWSMQSFFKLQSLLPYDLPHHRFRMAGQSNMPLRVFKLLRAGQFAFARLTSMPT